MKSHSEENTTLFNSATWAVPWENLEASLLEYQKAPSSTPFSIKSVSLATKRKPVPQANQEEQAKEYIKAKEESQDLYSTLLQSIPEFGHIGGLFKSSKPLQLTELETEYVINCVKHTFPKHIVLQFNVTNTLQEQLLENLTIKLDVLGNKDLKIEAIIPIDSLPYGPPGKNFVCV